MSLYCLSTASHQNSVEADLGPLLSRHGFRPHLTLDVAGRTLSVFDNPGQSVISMWEGAEGGFALSIGPFLYGGYGGEAALARYHAHFAPEWCPWQDTQGHYTLILFKQGRLFVLCDALGAHKIYVLPGESFLSNSFLATLLATPDRRFDRLGCYHYVWAGSCYGGRSFVQGLGTLPANSVVSLQDGKTKLDPRPSPILDKLGGEAGGFEENVSRNAEAICDAVARWSRVAEGGVKLSFSGGFDSRLLLAALMAAGERPALYTYGSPDDPDVEIARQVAAAASLPFDHIDKSAFPPPPSDAFAERLDEATVLFDGWKNDGLIDLGEDAADRAARHASGALPFNGGLGEIYRNFHNLRPGRYRAGHVVASFYSQYHPGWATRAFDPEAYGQALAHRMRDQLGVAYRTLTAQETQLLYPLFRGRFWTAREAEINQRFGAMAFPYLEHSVIRTAAATPLRQKDNGRLQAAMIAHIDPALAALPSGYGFAFSEAPSRAFRADAILSRHKPMWVRRRTYRYKRRGPAAHPPELQDAMLSRVMDPHYPLMSGLFRIADIRETDVLNRVATLEYLGQRFGIKEPR